MGQRYILTDDLNEEIDAVGQLSFFREGQEFEIDLGEENMKKYTEMLAAHAQLLDFLADHGRRVERQRKLAPKARTKADYDKIRDWARENGFPQVKDAGRIADHILKAYDNRVVASQKPVETTEEAPKGEETPETVQTVVEAPKPVAVPAAEFSAEMGKVLSLDAPKSNTNRKPAKVGGK